MRAVPLLLLAALPVAAPQGKEGFQTDPRFKVFGVFCEVNPAAAIVTPDGKTLVLLAGGPNECWVLEWDLETGEQKKASNLKDLVKQGSKVLLSPTGKWLWRTEYKELREQKTDQYGGKYEHVRPYTQFEILDPRSGRVDKTKKVFWQEDQTVGDDEEHKHMAYAVNGRVLLVDLIADQKKVAVAPVDGAFEISPDFRYIAGRSTDTLVSIVFDGMTRKVVVTPPSLQNRNAFLPRFGFSPNSKFVAASVGTGVAEVYRLRDGKPVGQVQGPKSPIERLRPDKDAARLCVLYRDRTIQFWQMDGAKLLQSHPVPADAGQCRIHVTRDGARAVLVGPWGATVYDFATGERLRTIHVALPPERAVSADGKLTATRIDNITIGMWRLDPAAFVWSRTLEKPVMRMLLSAKGDLVFVDPNSGPFQVLEGESGKTKASVPRKGEETLAGIDPSGEAMLLFTGTGLRRVGVADGKELWSLPLAPSTFVEISFDGKTALACGQKVQLIDAEKGEIVLALPQEPVDVALVSPDGSRLLLIYGDEARLLDRAGKLVRKIRLAAPIGTRRPSWSPDGKRIMFPDANKITVYESKGGEVARTYAYNTKPALPCAAFVTRDSAGIAIEGVHIVFKYGE